MIDLVVEANQLKNVSTDAIWESIIQCRSSVYMGLPHTFIVDSGLQFRQTFADISNCRCQSVHVLHNNSWPRPKQPPTTCSHSSLNCHILLYPITPVSVRITEVIYASDPRADSPKMRKAMLEETDGLIEKGAFRFTLRHELPGGANTLTGSFALVIKSKQTDRFDIKPDT